MHAGQSSGVKLMPRVQALLAYILLERNATHSYETLAGIFWEDYEKERARGCLSTALWRLRQALEPQGVPKGTYLVTTSTGEISFNRESPYWLDVAAFEEQVNQTLIKPVQALGVAEVEALEKVVQLYTSDLLEGIYSDWALRERERLRCLYLDSLAHLTHYYKHHGAADNGLKYGQRILQHDPLREEIHREVMRLYLANGQRALAVRQYEICRQVLAKELGIPPMEETRALYVQMVPEVGQCLTPPLPAEESAHLQQALQQLRRVRQGMDEIRKTVEQTIQFVEQLTGH